MGSDREAFNILEDECARIELGHQPDEFAD
jgi:hypothetical protein